MKRLVQGALIGAVATGLIGFGWGGWTLAGTAEKMAGERVTKALVTAYAPVCVERYTEQATDEQRVEFKAESKWKRDSWIEKSGFATPPGFDAPNREIADVCAEKISKELNDKT